MQTLCPDLDFVVDLFQVIYVLHFSIFVVSSTTMPLKGRFVHFLERELVLGLLAVFVFVESGCLNHFSKSA